MNNTARIAIFLTALLLTAVTLSLAVPTVPVPELKTQGNANVSRPALKVSLAGGAPAPKPEEQPSQPEPAPARKPTPEPQPEPKPKPEPEPQPEPEPRPEPEPKPAPPPPQPEPQPVEPTPTETEVSDVPNTSPVEADAAADTPEPDAGADQATQQEQVELVAGDDEAVDQYLGTLARHLARYREYPRRARRLGQEGTPVVIFEFDRNGRLLEARLRDSSSHRLLDEAALELLRDASPLPEVPKSMIGQSFTYTLPVGYKLR